MDFEREKAILVLVTPEKVEDDFFKELELLSKTAEIDVVGTMIQRTPYINPIYYMGSGKVEELKAAINELNASLVIFDNPLNGVQFNNLEAYLGVEVIDRNMLILKIFAMHASSNEGKLQVELAYKKYSLPKLLGKGTVLSRQGGGGGGGGGARRGAGEQQLELDRRTIRNEIKNLQSEIKKIGTERDIRRKQRLNSGIKTVSIVGYTNAGKSTLMNAMTKAGVLAEDKLFATLDPVSRKIWLGEKKEILLTDTVGFISRLPHEFIEAFKSTLEETKYADLILHVVDASSEKSEEQLDVVISVLKSIGVEDKPIITVYNKIDKAGEFFEPVKFNSVKISAKRGQNLEELKALITKNLF